MKLCTTVQLRDREIINLCDGTRLGYAEDFEFDLCDGRITALLLMGESFTLRPSKYEPFRIPWSKIECIGEDTVLVRIAADDPRYCEFVRKNIKKRKIL